MHMQRKWRCEGLMLSVGLLVMLINAAPASATLPMKSCELITAKDVDSVLGGGYAPQDLMSNQIMSMCGYTKGKGEAVSITLKREFQSAGELLKIEQDGIKQRGIPVTPLNGLGIGAY